MNTDTDRTSPEIPPCDPDEEKTIISNEEERTRSSETDFVHFCIAVVKNRYFFLALSCSCCLCGWLGDNLRNHGLIVHRLDPNWETSFGHFLSYASLVGSILFPVGICFAARKWLLVEKWMLLYLEAFVFALSFLISFQNPFVDNPFYDRPFMRLLYDFQCMACISVIFQGIPTILMHFATRDKGAAHTLPRRIISTASAVLLTILLLKLFFYFDKILG